MEKIELNEKQIAYKAIIDKVIKKEITTNQAALTLCLTQRCIEYKVNNYKLKGDKAFIHSW